MAMWKGAALASPTDPSAYTTPWRYIRRGAERVIRHGLYARIWYVWAHNLHIVRTAGPWHGCGRVTGEKV